MVRPEKVKLDLFAAAYRVQQADVGDGDAAHALQTLANHGCEIIHVEFSHAAVDQAVIDVGVYFSVGVTGVDSAQGVADFRETAQHGFHFPRFGFSDLQ